MSNWLKRYCLSLLFGVCSLLLTHAQSAGSSYSFLDLPYSARLSGLGGENVAIAENDLSFSMLNPALLNDATNMMVQTSYANLGGGLNFGTLGYSHNYKENRFAASFHFLTYGKMQGADIYGNLTGQQFGASDYLINLSYARQLGEMFSIGVSLKPIFSFYESYSSFALGADVGGYFHTKDSTFQMGLSMRNIGWQLKTFYETNHRELLPIDLAFGLNYRFKHAPIRLGMTIHDLQRWNLNYSITNQPNTSFTEFDTDPTHIKWGDMLFRHTVFTVEIVPKSDKFYISVAYNHQRHAELNNGGGFSLAGVALGAGINIKQFKLAVAYSQYLRGQNLFQVSLACSINKFLK